MTTTNHKIRRSRNPARKKRIPQMEHKRCFVKNGNPKKKEDIAYYT
jgi:hypothetical protein